MFLSFSRNSPKGCLVNSEQMRNVMSRQDQHPGRQASVMDICQVCSWRDEQASHHILVRFPIC